MASRYWIKLWLEILDDPKMGKMPDWLWRRTIELFLLAGENGNDGELPSVSDMAWRLRSEEPKLSETLRALERVGVVEPLPDGKWKVKNFAKRNEALSGAERMSLLREKKRKEEYQDDHGVTKRHTDTEAEIETETEAETEAEQLPQPETKNIFRAYEKEIGMITPMVSDALIQAEKDYTEDWISAAIGEAVEHNARNWAYISTILRSWKANGFKRNGQKNNGNGHPPNGSGNPFADEIARRKAEALANGH